mgnify:CR=1 FL=1
MEDVFWGLMIPFLGTTLGAACVFFMQGRLHRSVQRGLTGFASGVMVAASFFSLLLPALEQSAPMGRWAFLPAVIGFGVGVAFLLFLDHIIPHLHMNAETAEGPRSHLKKTTMLILAVTLHNIPEGIAVALPMYHVTGKKRYAMLYAALSGITEPIGALVGMFIFGLFLPQVLIGALMAAVAGIMIYISFDTLLPLAKEYGDWHQSIVGILSGILVIWVSLILIGA